MNTSSGESSKKEHLTNGSKIVCSVKSSGINKNDKDSFSWIAENYPEKCCTKCLNYFRLQK